MFTYKDQSQIDVKRDGMYCNSFPARLLNRNRSKYDVNISVINNVIWNESNEKALKLHSSYKEKSQHWSWKDISSISDNLFSLRILKRKQIYKDYYDLSRCWCLGTFSRHLI